jgi:hypothetical protein
MYILKISHLLSRVLFPHDFINVIVSWMDPYSCILFSLCSAYSDLGLLILMYLSCSENLAFRDSPVWPMYDFTQVQLVSF